MRISKRFDNLVALVGVFACCLPAHAAPAAFDRIESAYAPYLNHEDPFAWPAKVWSLSANEYKFWRGSKDCFFIWCKDHCADWAADVNAFVPAHGDLHQGNIGSYASDASFGSVAFGMVDFDDSTRLPFQVELLEGLITLRLLAGEADLRLDGAQWAQIDGELIASYRAALEDPRPRATRLAEMPAAKKLATNAGGVPYAKELEKFCDGSTFRTKIVNGKGELTEVLRPIAAGEYDAFAIALAEACENDDAMARRLRGTTATSLRPRIKAIASRTRLGSSGSQGLKKYLVLLDKPLAGIESDIILYLKQEIPTAAERAGYVALDNRTPGERAQQMMSVLTEPQAFLSSHASLHGESFWVSLKEPWSDELSDRVNDVAALRDAAVVWGTVTGVALSDPIEKSRVASRLDVELVAVLRDRADAYVTYQRGAFAEFTNDARAVALKNQAADALKALAR